MMWWMWGLLAIYVCGFFLTLYFHVLLLPMVTPALALLRSAVWPIFWATGWPHGFTMPMD